jgi:hypothetical protein
LVEKGKQGLLNLLPDGAVEYFEDNLALDEKTLNLTALLGWTQQISPRMLNLDRARACALLHRAVELDESVDAAEDISEDTNGLIADVLNGFRTKKHSTSIVPITNPSSTPSRSTWRLAGWTDRNH